MKVKFKDESVSIQFKNGRTPITPGNLTQEVYESLIKESETYASLFEFVEEEKAVKVMPKNKE